MNADEARTSIAARMRKAFESNKHLHNAYLLVHSDRHHIHWKFAQGKIGGVAVHPDQPYHTASIGKTFTALIIAILVRERKLAYDDPVSKYVSGQIMEGLHIHKGTDYSAQLTIEHLISNTSGLPDYYEGKPKGSKRFYDLIFDEPDRWWTPQETIAWTKQHLAPKFPPGRKVHYADGNFDLLGLIIEKVTDRPYHEALHQYIFAPLQMKQSYLSHYSVPEERSELPAALLTAKDNTTVNFEKMRSFSSFYASGQTVSTSEDLYRFIRALAEHRIVPESALAQMMNWRRLYIGVRYGYGLMKIKMNPLTTKFDVWGHLGSIGSFMVYCPGLDVYAVGNFNKAGYTAGSIRFLSGVLQDLAKMN